MSLNLPNSSEKNAYGALKNFFLLLLGLICWKNWSGFTRPAFSSQYWLLKFHYCPCFSGGRLHSHMWKQQHTTLQSKMMCAFKDIGTHSLFYCFKNLFQVFPNWQDRLTGHKLRCWFYTHFATWSINFYWWFSVSQGKIYSRSYFVSSHWMWKAHRTQLCCW